MRTIFIICLEFKFSILIFNKNVFYNTLCMKSFIGIKISPHGV